jgi:hypothetical protein
LRISKPRAKKLLRTSSISVTVTPTPFSVTSATLTRFWSMMSWSMMSWSMMSWSVMTLPSAASRAG